MDSSRSIQWPGRKKTLTIIKIFEAVNKPPEIFLKTEGKKSKWLVKLIPKVVDSERKTVKATGTNTAADEAK